ncbi:MAG: hypothetical protein WA949_02685 [Phormidesmis sp.]
MKPISSANKLRTLGLTTLIAVIVGTNVQQAAQAQFFSTGNKYMTCSEAYFSDPDQMYFFTGESLEALRQRGVLADYEQAIQPLLDEQKAILDSITVFAVDLDAPIGYVAKEVNGVAVEIPADIKQAIEVDMAYPYSREKAKMLNEKYGQYATLGQQITLVYSSAQTLRMHEIARELNAIAATYVTPEEEQANRELAASMGYCYVNEGLIGMGILTQVVEVGNRPDLDARLRADTTGATFFQ